MLVTKTIELKISNNGRYWRELGYGECKQGDTISVVVDHLPKNSNKIVTYSCDECEAHFDRPYQLLMRPKKCVGNFCYECSREIVGKIMDTTKLVQKNNERSGEKHPRWNPDRSKLSHYGSKVRALSERVYRENIDIINPERHPRGRCGVPGAYQLDHKRSIKECFLNDVSAEEAAALDNLQLLPWKDNRSKGS